MMMNDIGKAIEELKRISELDTGLNINPNISSYDLLTAIEALQEKAEREKGCKYCTGENPTCFWSGDGWDIYFRSDLQEFYANEYPSPEFKFCPNCGRGLRKLVDEECLN